MRIYLFLILMLPLAARSQGLFLGATAGEKGLTGFKAGYSLGGILEIGAMYNPLLKKSSNGGYAGGLLKLPLYYKPIGTTYSSTFLFGVNLSGNAGLVLYPKADTLSLTNAVKVAKNDLGRAVSLGFELMWFGESLGISIPIDLGYGKMHFTQSFDRADPNTFHLKNDLYVMAGIKIFLSRNHCRDYIENLNGGY